MTANEQTPAKAVVLLSTKSSGSSVVQDVLASTGRIRHVEHTRHQQHETLFWTKAASVLGRPQRDMLDSEVPIPPERARQDLIRLLADNTDDLPSDMPSDDDGLVFEGWRRLVEAHRPVFFEKSPHHLVQRPCLALLVEAMERVPSIEMQLVGLVRHPMDTLYSAYRRWRTPPEALQFEWAEAYRNLQWLSSTRPDHVQVIRYEDVVADPGVLAPVTRFCGVDDARLDAGRLHAGSIGAWRTDGRFGFTPDRSVVELAGEFGYDPASMTNEPSRTWPVRRRVERVVVRTGRRIMGVR
ncbi:sulfotransferase [Euzebya tangerina]|uniref:sulfotransferase n=1 Tax=Euzebya tangerina TaxID=591198 RepID=UPI000E3139A3|nr:sulfotransferase [Euzebya tangerina]